MPEKYGPDAHERCRQLYCKYGGSNYDAIQAEMQKDYPGWRKSNLFDRKKRKEDRVPQLGWINRFGFEKSLALYTQTLVESVNDDEQDLYVSIKAVRKRLKDKAVAGTATKDELYQFRDFAKLEIEARRNLDLTRDNLETFVAGYEKLVQWAPPDLKKLLVKYGEKLVEMAQAHYGSSEEVDDGAGPREDEGGEQPSRRLSLVR